MCPKTSMRHLWHQDQYQPSPTSSRTATTCQQHPSMTCSLLASCADLSTVCDATCLLTPPVRSPLLCRPPCRRGVQTDDSAGRFAAGRANISNNSGSTMGRLTALLVMGATRSSPGDMQLPAVAMVPRSYDVNKAPLSPCTPAQPNSTAQRD